MPFDLGDTVRLSAECRDADGALKTAGTATLTLTLPDGTTESPTVSAPATEGTYVHDYAPTLPGRHSVRWVFSDPNSAYTDVFDVREPDPPSILSLADAKAQLNITSDRDDEELRSWIEATTALVEQFTGLCVTQTFTETHRINGSGTRAIVLKHTPVRDVISVDGAPLSSLSVSNDTGVVRCPGGLLYGSVTVTYTAGRTVIPASITKAALIILQHLWQTQRNTFRGGLPGVSGDTEIMPGLGYAIPNRAMQLMEPYRTMTGVA